MVADSNLYEVESSDQFKELLSKDLQRVSLLYFWAPWAEPCKQMSEVVSELSKKYSKLLSLQIEAETQEDIAESFDIESVPTFIILRVRCTFIFLRRDRATQIHLLSSIQGHTLLDRISGADARGLTEAIVKHVGSAESTLPLSHSDKSPAAPSAVEKVETPEELERRLRGLMTQSKVVLFMKGSPDEPRCGFSRKICGLLRDNKVEFSHFDILKDETVRQGEPRPVKCARVARTNDAPSQVLRKLMTGPPTRSLL